MNYITLAPTSLMSVSTVFSNLAQLPCDKAYLHALQILYHTGGHYGNFILCNIHDIPVASTVHLGLWQLTAETEPQGRCLGGEQQVLCMWECMWVF